MEVKSCIAESQETESAFGNLQKKISDLFKDFLEKKTLIDGERLSIESEIERKKQLISNGASTNRHNNMESDQIECVYENLESEMNKLSKQQRNLQQVQRVLQDSVNKITLARQGWKKLVDFFHHLSTSIEIKLFSQVRSFISTGTYHGQITQPVRDILERNCSGILDTVELLQMISFLYMYISKKYLSPSIGDLPTLIGINPKESMPEIERVASKLQTTCDKAVKEIEVFFSSLKQPSLKSRKRRERNKARFKTV